MRHSIVEKLRRHLSQVPQAESAVYTLVEIRKLLEHSQEVPVTITPEDYAFKYLKRLELLSLEPAKAIVDTNPGKKYFGLNWKFTLNDGTTFNLPYTSNLMDE